MATPGKPAAGKAAAPQNISLDQPATQVFLLVMLVAAVIVLYYLLFYSPLQGDIAHERTRGSRLNADLNDARTAEQSYNHDREQLVQSRRHARDLRGILPDNADMPGFMRSINTLAEASGLRITLIEPQDEQVEQYYVRLPVRVEMTGNYLALARFFHAISALPRVINMEDITLAEPAEETGEVHVHARVEASTFRALTPEETARRHAPAGPNGANAPSGGRR